MPRHIDHAERRREIAEAAWRVILHRGVTQVSIRTVAAEASLSTGSLRHVIPTYAELLATALDLVHAQVLARVLNIPPGLAGRARALAIAEELLPLDAERRAEFEVQLSLTTLSFSEPAVRLVRDRADAAVRDACCTMIELLFGSDEIPTGIDVDLEAQRLYAVIDGLALHLVHRCGAFDASRARAIVEHHLDALSALRENRDNA